VITLYCIYFRFRSSEALLLEYQIPIELMIKNLSSDDFSALSKLVFGYRCIAYDLLSPWYSNQYFLPVSLTRMYQFEPCSHTFDHYCCLYRFHLCDIIIMIIRDMTRYTNRFYVLIFFIDRRINLNIFLYFETHVTFKIN